MKKVWMRYAVAMVVLGLSGQVMGQDTLKISSTDFKPNQPVAEKHMLNGFGCTGGNVSPALSWQSAPKGTKSFVLTMYDPDAPTGSGWWHWVVYNIPAGVNGLIAGAEQNGGLPTGAVQGQNDGGEAHYGGPCPPKGAKAHRYVLTVHALNVEKLELPPTASPAFVGFMTGMHRLGKASLTVKVGR